MGEHATIIVEHVRGGDVIHTEVLECDHEPFRVLPELLVRDGDTVRLRSDEAVWQGDHGVRRAEAKAMVLDAAESFARLARMSDEDRAIVFGRLGDVQLLRLAQHADRAAAILDI